MSIIKPLKHGKGLLLLIIILLLTPTTNEIAAFRWMRDLWEETGVEL